VFTASFQGETEKKANLTDKEQMQSSAENLKADNRCQKPVTLLALGGFLLLLLHRVFRFHSCIFTFDSPRQTLEGP